MVAAFHWRFIILILVLCPFYVNWLFARFLMCRFIHFRRFTSKLHLAFSFLFGGKECLVARTYLVQGIFLFSINILFFVYIDSLFPLIVLFTCIFGW